MDEWPEVLLIEIFSYLRFSDLCELTLTCKIFNEIISNSSRLMDKFRLKFNENVDLMMEKKFRRIKIRNVNKRLHKNLERYGKNFHDITVDHSYFEPQDLIKILNSCLNFKTLKLDNYCFNDELIEPLSKLSFNSLSIIKYPKRVFPYVVSKRNEKSLDMQCFWISKSFINFLKNQKQLKILRLYDSNLCYGLFKDDSLANTDFQLETLVIELQVRDIFYRENFKKFLKNQKSLKKFFYFDYSSEYYFNFGYADVLNDLKSVKELELNKSFFDIIPMHHIEVLRVAIKNDRKSQDFKNLFPNLINLKIQAGKIKFVEYFTELTLKDYVEIRISENVKTLTIVYAKFESESLFDDDVVINIENLTIYCSDNINWLIECFKNDRIKLKSLEIVATGMKKSQEKYLESLLQGENKKIDVLKIYMPMELNENENECTKRIKFF